MAGKFEPKVPVQLDTPKDDPISTEVLAQANGMSETSRTLWRCQSIFHRRKKMLSWRSVSSENIFPNLQTSYGPRHAEPS